MSAVGIIGKLAMRAASYWLLEPAKNTALGAVRSVRYFMFIMMIVVGVCTWINPSATLNVIKALTPQVEIKAPSILQGQ